MSLSDDGYLLDPTSEYGGVLNPHVKSFADLALAPCLVLLGEPGMGKSTALMSEFENIRQQSDAPATLLTDLRRYGSEVRLLNHLTTSPVIRAWADGKSILHLFLDSVDECLLRIDTLATLLPEALSLLPKDRLKLRIACRTGDWPQTLEGHLVGIFGKERTGVYELTPLRRVDVATAARSNALDSDEFLREVAVLEVQALANRPVTLEFLLQTKRQGKSLPRRKVDLYSGGCKILSAEINLARRDARQTGRLGSDQRLRVAEQLAAATVFGNRYAIWTGSEADPVPPEDLTFEGLRRGVAGSEALDNETLEEVIGTGLFSSRGPHRMGWAHQTYAEFLAGSWAADPRLELDQLLGLLTNPHDPERRLIPQLHETAAWTATMRADAFRALVELDPEALLKGDIATAEPEQRRVLVQALLEGYASERIVDTDWGLRSLYRKLAHPDLADQLRPFIIDRKLGEMVRRAAINMAEACDLRALEDELIGIALDRAEPNGLRQAAGSAAASVSDAEHRLRLRPLLETTFAEDPDDQIRASALAALWPNQLTAKELFRCIQQPRRPQLYGSYKAFIRHDLPQTLTRDHLAVALEWVLEQEPHRRTTSDVLEDLADEIVMRVWRSKPSGRMKENLAEVVIRRRREFVPIIGREHQQELSELLQEDPEARKTFVLAVLERMGPKDDVWSLWNSGPTILDRSSLPWLLDWLVHGEGSEEAKRLGAESVRHLYDPRSADEISAVLEAAEQSPALRTTIAPFFEPVELGSSKALEMKTQHEEHLRRLREHQEWEAQHFKPLDPPPAERVQRCLEQCEAGDPDGFWHLTLELTLEPGSRHYGEESESDLTKASGWEEANRETRARIINAAKHYILERDPGTGEWLGKRIWHRPAFAGYKALRLMTESDPQFLAGLSVEIWTRWAPTIVGYPSRGTVEENRSHELNLVSQAYRAAPDVTLAALVQCLESDNAELGMVFGLERFGECWDDRLSRCLLDRASEPSTKPRAFQQLLSLALDHGLVEAETLARGMLEQPILNDGPDRERVVLAGTVLLLRAPSRTWELVRRLIEGDDSFGRGLVSAIANERYGSMLRELQEDNLADLYIWISHRYPHSEDSNSEGGWVSLRDQIATLRNAILNALKERGSFEAGRAIQTIMEQLPKLGWLKYALHDARAMARAKTWDPPLPQEVLALGGSTAGRLVRSGRELLDAIVASLRRLDEELQGETPAAIDLWNEFGKGRFRPKDENDLSNYVKRHLDKDLKRQGVVVNREVEIRRGVGDGLGETPDIHVDAFVRDGHDAVADVVTAIVEVKGCWHRELSTAMESQLVGRYLKDNPCQHGLYLVGWYNCPQWDPDDDRSTRAPTSLREEAEQRFASQAGLLSTTDLDVRAFVLNTALR